MSQTFFEKLEKRVEAIQSLLCIGLDPHVGELPEATAEAALEFCVSIIEETHPYAAAFKPNSAFFEQFGPDGMNALIQLMDAIPSDVPVILDCKRGDIDTTAQAYAIASYDIYLADAVTLHGYMGWDSIKPFVTDKYKNKGVFTLCKTSNPSSKDMQTITTTDNCTLYEHVAKLCNKWNSDGEIVGLVAGATDLPALKTVREICPNSWILCPGVGAQGGEANEVCEVGLRSDGSGLLVSVSRGISKASDKAAAAIALRDEINLLRASTHTNKRRRTESSELIGFQKEFIEIAITKNALQFGSFKLKSGRISPYFFNAGLFSCGMSISNVSRCYAKAIKESGIEFDVIFGPAYKGIPLCTAIATAWYEMYGESKNVSYNRKEAKDHGEGGVLVGASVAEQRVIIVDDVITAGTAIREAVEILHSAKAKICAVTVCLDRQEKTSETSAESAIQQVESEYGFPVLSIIKLKHLLTYVKDSSDGSLRDNIANIEDYRLKYGVNY